ncbi:sulfatase [Cerasicoccus maritimus]|uniref:sulfatase n=1 Tax=Cerasicoccus maritimus TaxID=490089 RepID=UPI002852CC9B|nr:sulfatase [Cerasicoccus maritimus]
MKIPSSFLKVALVGAAFCCALTASAADRPNVLFLSVDDLKPTIGAYGDSMAITPNIDRLADSGSLMVNNHCQQAVCAPSRMSMFTGLRPDSTKVWDLRTQIQDSNPSAVTMQQLFKENGYTTAGSGKVMHGARNEHPESWSVPFTSKKDLPYAEGFKVPAHDNAFYQGEHEQDVYAEMQAENIRDWRKRMKYMAEHNAMPSMEGLDIPDDAYADGALANWAINQLEDYAKTKEPFFLTVGFMKPHLPFVAPKKYWDLYDQENIPLAEFREHAENTPDWVYHKYGELRSYSDITRDWNTSIDDDTARALINGYYACVSYVDAQIGRVLDKLDELGLSDNTIVVLWGDHGWHLGDHDMWCKHSNFEQATRAPLIIHAPGYQPGVVNSMTEFVDIFPTLVELAGLEEPYELEGASLVPVLKDSKAKVKDYSISQYNRRGNTMGYALRTERYRYVMWMGKDWRTTMPFDPSLVEFVELYDYDSDPLETVNQAENIAYADVASELRGQMLEYFKTYEEAPASMASAPAGSSTSVDLSAINLGATTNRFAQPSRDGDGIIIDFELSKKWPSVDFYAPGGAWNLSANGGVEVSITNLGSETYRATAYMANDGDVNANKMRAGNGDYITGGETKTIKINFADAQGNFNPGNINYMRVFADKLTAPAKLRINSVKAVGTPVAGTPQASARTAPRPASAAAPAQLAGTSVELIDPATVNTAALDYRFAKGTHAGNDLILDFENNPKWPSVDFFAPGSWDLSAASGLDISLTNIASTQFRAQAYVANPDDTNADRKRANANVMLAPGDTKVIHIKFSDSPKFRPNDVSYLRIFVDKLNGPAALRVNSITTAGGGASIGGAPQASATSSSSANGVQTGSTGLGQIKYIRQNTSAPAASSAASSAPASAPTGSQLLDLSKVSASNTELRFTKFSQAPNGLVLDYELSPKWPSIQFFRQEGGLWDLSGYQYVDVTLTNESAAPVKTFAFIANPGHTHQNKKAVSEKTTIAPGATETISIKIDPSVPNFNPAQIEELRVFIGMHKAPVRLLLTNIILR